MTNIPLERKIAHSFRLVRQDIDKIQVSIKRIEEDLNSMHERKGPDHSMLIPVSSLRSSPKSTARKPRAKRKRR